MQSLNDETKDSACFTRKFYVKSAKALARIEEGKLWLLDQLFKKHVYVVFHNQFLVALKRLQVDKQELVHKSANETVMASTYTRIKAIPIGHIRLINGDNLDTHDGIHNTCCHPPKYRWKDDETTQSVLLLTTINSKTLGDPIVAMHVLQENISSSQGDMAFNWKMTHSVFALLEEMIMKSKKLLREREVSSREDTIKLDVKPYESFRSKGEGPKPSEDYK
ncbi:hypothetical protein Bca4012_030266 [Brassica carinata]